jgi:hypothetical protein
MDERMEEILDGIWYELMTMNAMRALELVHNPCLSSEERGFVEGVASSVIEAGEEDDGDGKDE